MIARSAVYRGDVPKLTALGGTPGWGSPRRWGVFTAGYTCLVVGIAMSITADLGVGSWQVLETGLVETTGLAYGTVVLVEAAVMLTLAWVWLGQRPWIATALLACGGLAIGALLDVMSTPEAMLSRAVLLAAATVLISVGVAFYLAADLGASAQDAVFVGLYLRYALRPGRLRFVMDGGLVVIGALLGGQLGIGTLAVTLAVPALIEPAMRVGHRLADTPLPPAMQAHLAPPLAPCPAD
ncbi:hypothetical protein BH23ACT9_BH23ACT9_21120 [soil metagenome]